MNFIWQFILIIFIILIVLILLVIFYTTLLFFSWCFDIATIYIDAARPTCCILELLAISIFSILGPSLLHDFYLGLKIGELASKELLILCIIIGIRITLIKYRRIFTQLILDFFLAHPIWILNR